MSDPTVPETLEVDRSRWSDLEARAAAMVALAYAPYSRVHVGAAALVDDGRIVEGCNVENASTGIGICAEVNLTGALVASGGGRLVALSVLAGDHQPILPCGRCRQFLYEFGGPDLLIATPRGVVTLGELLPDAFGPAELAARVDPAPSSGSVDR
ncbi:MAG: cytidine deaminase [Microthrixaceae bacterium]